MYALLNRCQHLMNLQNSDFNQDIFESAKNNKEQLKITAALNVNIKIIEKIPIK